MRPKYGPIDSRHAVCAARPDAPVFGQMGYNGGLANWDLMHAYSQRIPLEPGRIAPWRPLVNAYLTNLTALAYPMARFAAYVSHADAVETGRVPSPPPCTRRPPPNLCERRVLGGARSAPATAHWPTADTPPRRRGSFYSVEGCGLDGCDWSKAMRAAFEAISAPNFHRFIGPGTSHGAAQLRDFYELDSHPAEAVRLARRAPP